MMKFIRKFLLSPIIGLHWVNALESAAREDYYAANKLLTRIKEYFEGRDVEYHLLRAYVNFRLSQFNSAVADCMTANRLLEQSARYKEEEKKYLRCYAYKVASSAITNIPKESRPEEFNKVVCTGIQYKEVRQALRLSFPISEIDDEKVIT